MVSDEDSREKYTVERGGRSWVVIDDLTDSNIDDLIKNCNFDQIHKEATSKTESV